jgi:hypothetical protein
MSGCVSGDISTTIYPAAGSSIDWIYEKFSLIFSGAPELRVDLQAVQSTIGIDRFHPPNELITPSIKGELDAVDLRRTELFLPN